MAKADTQKAKGDIWWRSARTFGQESNPATLRPVRMNAYVLANGSMSSNQFGESEFRNAIIKANLVEWKNEHMFPRGKAVQENYE